MVRFFGGLPNPRPRLLKSCLSPFRGKIPARFHVVGNKDAARCFTLPAPTVEEVWSEALNGPGSRSAATKDGAATCVGHMQTMR